MNINKKKKKRIQGGYGNENGMKKQRNFEQSW